MRILMTSKLVFTSLLILLLSSCGGSSSQQASTSPTAVSGHITLPKSVNTQTITRVVIKIDDTSLVDDVTPTTLAKTELAADFSQQQIPFSVMFSASTVNSSASYTVDATVYQLVDGVEKRTHLTSVAHPVITNGVYDHVVIEVTPLSNQIQQIMLAGNAIKCEQYCSRQITLAPRLSIVSASDHYAEAPMTYQMDEAVDNWEEILQELPQASSMDSRITLAVVRNTATELYSVQCQDPIVAIIQQTAEQHDNALGLDALCPAPSSL